MNTTNKKLELLLCPFCGCEAEYVEDIDMEGIRNGVCCTECLVSISSTFADKDELIEKWNTRTPLKESKETKNGNY